MKITRSSPDARPADPKPSPRRLPDAPAVWAGLAVVGATALGIVAGRDDALVVVIGIGAVATGAYQLGRRVLRDDPRVAALTEQLARVRRSHDTLLEHLAAERMELAARPADGDGGRGAGAPAPAARPSAGLHGGGRPGRVGLAPVPSLDDPLDAAEPGADEVAR